MQVSHSPCSLLPAPAHHYCPPLPPLPTVTAPAHPFRRGPQYFSDFLVHLISTLDNLANCFSNSIRDFLFVLGKSSKAFATDGDSASEQSGGVNESVGVRHALHVLRKDGASHQNLQDGLGSRQNQTARGQSRRRITKVLRA